MIRTTIVAYWNHVKGGVDEFSRTLKVLSYQKKSGNPIDNVFSRLICAQINNAAVVYRLSVAKGCGLPLENNAYQRELKKVTWLCETISPDDARFHLSNVCWRKKFWVQTFEDLRESYLQPLLQNKI